MNVEKRKIKSMTKVTPKLQVLTAEQKKKVHCDAVSILENTGIIVEENKARSLFEKAIGKSHKDHRVQIPGELIQWAIDVSPSTITICNRLGNPCFELTGY